MSKPSDSDRELLSLDTPILLRELGSGHCLAQAVVAPSQASFGSDVEALDQQRKYLERILVSAGPQMVARFDLPGDYELIEVVVELERLTLPVQVRRKLALTVACVRAPHGRDSWILVPGIGHTFHVGAGEDLAAVAAGEIARIVNAASGGEIDVRRLLPADDTWIEPVTVGLLTGRDSLAGRALGLRKKRIEEHRRKRALEILGAAAVPLHDRVESPPPLVGRDRELAALDALLSASSRASVLVVGAESVGKSALIRSWLAPRARSRLVYSTSIAQLIAGASGFGEWQERVNAVIGAAEQLDAILYFENLGELFGEHPEQGGVDVASLLRRQVVEERIRVVGEITPELLESARRHHVALLGAMATVRVEPLDAATTVRAVAERIDYWQRHHRRYSPVAPEVARPLVDLAARYLPYRAFPGVAIRFLEELRATRGKLRGADGNPLPISLQDCYDAFSLSTGIPGFLLREDQPLLLDQLVEVFRRRMVGQAEAVKRVAETICLVKARLQPADKPLATFLFVGPTGVGKTELARTVAHYLFGSADRMTRFDMSEYTDPLAAERLIRGTARVDGLLTGKVREQPFCVLLLDEIEKAHPAVHDLLLQVCGEGRLTDARGRTTYFHNAIIIMTSNLGAAHRRAAIGIAAGERSAQDHYERSAREAFRPEMINRIDRIVSFDALTPAEVAEVAKLALARIHDRRGLQENGIAVELSEPAAAALAAAGYSEAYGVRALRRHLDDALVTPLAHELARLGTDARGAQVWVGVDGEEAPRQLGRKHRISRSRSGDLVIELYRRADVVGAAALRGMARVGDRRRRADGLMRLDEAVDLVSQVGLLRAQLAADSSPRRRRKSKRAAQRRGVEIDRLRASYHRLSTALDGARRAQEDLHAAEELALVALLSGEETEAIKGEVEELYRGFLRAFFGVLVARLERRHCAMLRVARVGSTVVWRLWLAPLLAFCRARGWQVAVHVPKSADHRAYDWPEERPWGPPRELAWLEGQIESEPDTLDRLLLVVRGPEAGVILPVEKGIHCFRGYHANHAFLKVDLVSLTGELDDETWLSESLAAPPPRSISRRAPLARAWDKGERTVAVGDRVPVDISDGYFAVIEELGLEHLLLAREQGGLTTAYSAHYQPPGADDE